MNYITISISSHIIGIDIVIIENNNIVFKPFTFL